MHAVEMVKSLWHSRHQMLRSFSPTDAGVDLLGCVLHFWRYQHPYDHSDIDKDIAISCQESRLPEIVRLRWLSHSDTLTDRCWCGFDSLNVKVTPPIYLRKCCSQCKGSRHVLRPILFSRKPLFNNFVFFCSVGQNSTQFFFEMRNKTPHLYSTKSFKGYYVIFCDSN